MLESNYSRYILFTGYMPVNDISVLAQAAVDVGITHHLLSQDEQTLVALICNNYTANLIENRFFPSAISINLKPGTKAMKQNQNKLQQIRDMSI